MLCAAGSQEADQLNGYYLVLIFFGLHVCVGVCVGMLCNLALIAKQPLILPFLLKHRHHS